MKSKVDKTKALKSEIKRLNRNFLILSIIILLILLSILILSFDSLSENLLIIFSAIIISFVGYASYTLYERYTDYKNYPVIKKIMKMEKPDELLSSLEEDFEDLDKAVKLRNTFLTKSWLIRKSKFGLEVFPLSDISWVFPRKTNHYINGIPTGTTYGLVIVLDSYKRRIDQPCNEDESYNLIRYLTYKTPWVDFGYKDEFRKKHKLPFFTKGNKIALAFIALFFIIIILIIIGV